MNRKDAIENFYNELSARLYDIKAETLVNQALQNHLHAEDFVAMNDGRFVREYRPDLYDVNRIEDSRLLQLLQLRLSRSGLYDLVPEGLFHQSYTAKPGSAAVEMAAQSRIDKKKEQAARKFFQPIENSFFRQQVMIEQQEEHILAGINNGLLNDYFFTFWEFPGDLNKTSAMLLVLLLPYAHEIAGDLSLMQDCLRILLQENVTISMVQPSACEAPATASELGIGDLGNDMVCGHTFNEDYPCLQYVIGPLQRSKPVDYVTGGDNDLLLQVFNNYFAPFEADILIEVEVDRARALVELSEDESPILGYAVL